MTVSSELSRKTYVGNGATTSFDTNPMVFFDDTDLTVYVVTTATGAVVATLTLGTHYTVTGGDGTTGTVNLAGGSSPYGAHTAAQTLVVVRELGITQGSDFIQNDASDAEVTEDALDRLTMICQELNTRLDRSFVLANTDVSGASLTVPTPSANKLIGWNAAADALENKTAADISLALITDFVLSLVDDPDADTFIETIIDGGADIFQQVVDNATAETAPAVGDLIMLSDVSLTPDAGRKMTLENMFKVVNGLTADLQPDKTADYLLTYDASGSAAKRVLMQQLPLPRSYLAGLGMANNSGDATNDIDFSVGEARDSTNVTNLVAATAMTKQLDVAWAAGSAAGGRMSAAGIANTTYHCYVIRKDSDGTCDFGFDTSPTAPTMPSGYTYFRRIGSIIRSGGAIKAFTQTGDLVTWKVAAADVTSVVGSTANRTAVTVTAPPSTIVIGSIFVNAAAETNYVLVTDIADTDTAPSASAFTGVTLNANASAVASAVEFQCKTSATSTIGTRFGVANTYNMVTKGYIDRRGRDD